MIIQEVETVLDTSQIELKKLFDQESLEDIVLIIFDKEKKGTYK
jgi:hypothetical protein